MDEDEALLGQLMEGAKTLLNKVEEVLAVHQWQ